MTDEVYIPVGFAGAANPTRGWNGRMSRIFIDTWPKRWNRLFLSFTSQGLQAPYWLHSLNLSDSAASGVAMSAIGRMWL